MSESDLATSPEAEPEVRSRSAWRDPRVWVGLAVTVAAVAFTLRDVSFAEVGAAMAQANPWWLLLVVAPANVASLWVRGARWHHLAAHVAPVETAAAYRATAIGYLVNNLLPLRIGEVVRAWVLARESGGSVAALFGTVVLERIFDLVTLLVIGLWVIGQRVDLGIVSAAAAVPILGIVLLRLRPEWPLAVASRVGHWVLPERLATGLDRLLREVVNGLAGLGSGPGGARHLAGVVVWSIVHWAIVIPITFYGAIRALPLGLQGTAEELFASFQSMLFVAIAVAIPSAPGFFGVYHAACREALVPLGVSPNLALAMGTLSHVAFWLTLVACGLLALRSRGYGLGQLLAGASARPGGESVTD